jgi:hypothetical protein
MWEAEADPVKRRERARQLFEDAWRERRGSNPVYNPAGLRSGR